MSANNVIDMEAWRLRREAEQPHDVRPSRCGACGRDFLDILPSSLPKDINTECPYCRTMTVAPT